MKWIPTIIFWLSGSIFLGIAVYALKRKSPMNFWSTSAVSKDEINDIPSYNRANAIMWGVYGLIFLIIGFICLMGYIDMAAYLVLIFIFCSIPVLAFVYSRIYKKYAGKDKGH